MKVLVACEFSGIVRNAFRAQGCDAWSCDLLPAEDNSQFHFQCDARELNLRDWDLLIAHPPCTRLCNSGVRWLSAPPRGKTLKEMWADLDEGAELFSYFLNAPTPHVCIENPTMHKYAKERIKNYCEPRQAIQPWQFGDAESKRTCLWLRNLPPLKRKIYRRPHNVSTKVHLSPQTKDRWKNRSRFFPSVAAEMAKQWTAYIKGEAK
ncbi:hypothetical protein D6827_00190 [Candidatus Parcubacteria bacterium]|nr:MAG: hypothetical protein D6827_00190 [Candidatus Parcubacteria bacterium]